MSEQLSAEAKAWRNVALITMALLALVLLFETVRLLLDYGEQRDTTARELPSFKYELTSYADLPGWRPVQPIETVAAFARSCEKLRAGEPESVANPSEALGREDIDSFSGTVADWLPACDAAILLLEEGGTESDAGAFFEAFFTPVGIFQPGLTEKNRPVMTTNGLFTGYYEPLYSASREKTTKHSVPVLKRPEDLVMVDLGVFREELAGKRIAGRVEAGRLTPYADHREIVSQGLQTEIIGWMDPNDLLFLQIQGSGRLRFADEEIRVGYAAQNGHEYTAIGGPLIRAGEIAREDMSMQAIYNWLEAATPEEARDLRFENASYVFFRILDNLPEQKLGPVGAQGVQLTPGYSLAVDRRFHALGAPVWIDFAALSEGEREQRLVIAQDTGGAIKGAVRGDLFVGAGVEAAEVAGRMRQEGEMFVLLPTAVVDRLPD